MEYVCFLIAAAGIPWALPRLFPNGYAIAGIVICLLCVVSLFALAGEKNAQPYQVAITGVVIGAFLAARKYWMSGGQNGRKN